MRTIYIIQNSINDKVYIGQTNNFISRMRCHKCEALKSSYRHPLYDSIRKYGFNQFDCYVLEEVEDYECDLSEIFWIKWYKSCDRKYGYNLDAGGCKNKILSKETREKISNARKEYYKTHENHMLGKHHSEETKRKLSEIHKGKCYNTPEHMQRLAELAKKGFPHTEESKRKISEDHKGKCYNTPEHMQRLIELSRGRKVVHSEETKQKISKANLGKKHSEKSKAQMSKTHIERGTFAKEKNPMYGKSSELSPTAKFTWEIINNIRLDYSNGMRGRKLMEKYNVSETHMYRIIKNEIWVK